MDWTEVHAHPSYTYASADGLIDASIEFDDADGSWYWRVVLMEYVGEPGPKTRRVMTPDGVRLAVYADRGSGRRGSPDECKAEVARWLDEIERLKGGGE